MRYLGNSAFADHLISIGYSYEEGSAVLLCVGSSYFKHIALQDMEIARHQRKQSNFVVLNRILFEGGFINT